MKNYLTLEEIREMMVKPETWYTPYIPLMITEVDNGTQANLVEAED